MTTLSDTRPQRVFRLRLPTDVAPLNDVDFVGRLDVRDGQPPLRDVVVVAVVLVDVAVLHFAVVVAVQQEPFPSAEMPPVPLADAVGQLLLVEPALHEREQVVLLPCGFVELFHFPHVLYAACASALSHELVLAHVAPWPVVAALLASSSAPLSFDAP